jgi:hypothetical protein
MHVRGNAKMLLPDAANNCRCWSPVLFIVDVHICRIYLPLIKKHDTQVSCVSDDANRNCNLCIHSHDAGVPSHVHILYSSFPGYICQPSFAFVSPCLFWVGSQVQISRIQMLCVRLDPKLGFTRFEVARLSSSLLHLQCMGETPG